MVITAPGSVKHDKFVELVKGIFGDLKPGRKLKKEPPPESEAPRLVQQKKAIEQAHVMIGLPSFSVTHPRRFAAYTMNTLLGGGMSSRLFQNIRERRGLAYSVASELSAYRDTGCLGVFAGTSKQAVPEVLKLVFAELRELKENLVNDEELNRTKDHLKGSMILGLESTNSRMSNLAR